MVAAEGVTRLELFSKGELIDTVHVHRYTRVELNDLLVEMGQYRDENMTWEKVNAAKDFDNMVNNYSAYHDMTIPEE